ncbi:hypothetical protein L3X38_013837 [Prunus dulcis]|uniref:Uncharacterized protein n=1 Tax=Prunus dulcis TaxID=3755 RepID=A0AAD4WM29_PRUDU|nr:hypothetical protein L3X38_013837 [Prunus dulcis]
MFTNEQCNDLFALVHSDIALCPVRFVSEKPKPLHRREVREREALEIIVVFSNSQTWVLSSHLSSSVQRSSEGFPICKFFHPFSSGLIMRTWVILQLH